VAGAPLFERDRRPGDLLGHGRTALVHRNRPRRSPPSRPGAKKKADAAEPREGCSAASAYSITGLLEPSGLPFK
jgi:hypothetical protein